MRKTWAVVVLLSCGQSLEDGAGKSTDALSFGGLNFYLKSPAAPKPGAALVVALHGCTQTAADYRQAGWDAFAEANGFYVLYAEAPSGARCFRWFDASQIQRGQGEVAAIVQAVQHVRGQHDIDARKVFVTGLSAGGAMAAELLASYPDVFSAGAIMAGIPARCAVGGNSGTCQGGRDLSPKQWGDLVRAAASGPAPRVSIWAGDADYVVAFKNLNELMEQWTDVNGVDQTADVTMTVGRGTRREYADAAGVTRVETWTVSGMGHGTAVAPSAGCGQTGGFSLDVGLCSTAWSARFFGIASGGGGGGGSGAAGGSGGTAGGSGSAGGSSGGTAGGAAGGAPVSSCRQFEATNYDQVAAGRAVRCGSYNGYACAKGSGANLGLWNTFYRSTVFSIDGAYWSQGRCP